MPDLPPTYERFRKEFPELAEAYDALGQAAHGHGPLDQKTRQLVKLGLSVGARAEGAVRSHAKRAVEAGSGVSILPEPSVRREIAMGDLVKIAIEGEPLTRPLSIIHLRDRPLSQLAQQFVNELQADADFAEETSLALGTRSLEFGSLHRERPKHRAR